MTLRSRTAASIVLAFVGLALVLNLTLRSLVLRSFERAEVVEMRSSVERASNAIGWELGALDTMAADWAEWDDTYSFVANPTREYASANLSASSLRTLRVDAMLFFDSSHRLVTGVGSDPGSEEVTAPPAGLVAVLGPRCAALARSLESPSATGVTVTPEGPFLVAARAILTSGQQGPSRGVLVMARRFGPQEVAALGKLWQLSLVVEPWSGVSGPADVAAARLRLAAGDPTVVAPLGADRVAGYGRIAGVDGSPSLVVRVDAGRTTLAQGKLVVRLTLLTLLGAVLVFGLLTIGLIERSVIRRVSRLGDEVGEVAATASPSGRVTVEGRDEISGLARAINQMLDAQQQALLRLANSEKRYRQLFERNVAGVYRSTIAGRLLDCNQAFARIYGYASPEEVLAVPTPELYPSPHDREVFLQALREHGHLVNHELEGRKKDGTPVWVIETVGLVPGADSEPPVIEGTMIDVTERRLAEEKLLQAQKMELVGRLAGGIAHDFNNLLQAIMGITELMQLRCDNPQEVVVAATELQEHALRATALTRQLLLFARQEVSRVETIELVEFLRNSGRLLRRLVRENIGLVIESAGGAPRVAIDRGKLEQVLVNLVVNGSDAMPDGGTLVLRTGVDGGEAWIEVEDTGTGIAADVVPHLFEPFFTTKETGRGTGLGLPVVHGIVTERGGRVEVDSHPGRGSAFRVVLPALPGEGEVPAREDGDTAAIPRGEGERVLLVEDEAEARSALTRILGFLGYDVTVAASAEEAGLLPSSPAFDILVSDYLLPGAHGDALAHGLRDRWPSLAVILISGYTADDSELRERIGGGHLRFLQKPFSIVALARELRAALQEQRTTPAAAVSSP